MSEAYLWRLFFILVFSILAYVVLSLRKSDDHKFMLRRNRLELIDMINGSQFWTVVINGTVLTVMLFESIKTDSETVTCLCVQGEMEIRLTDFVRPASWNGIEKFKHDRQVFLHDQISKLLKEADEVSKYGNPCKWF